MQNLTTSRELLELIAEFVTAQSGGTADAAALQSIAQRLDVALGNYIVEHASVQNEG